jgi:hypothetical protein
MMNAMVARHWIITLIAAAGVIAGSAFAEPMTTGGLTFSDEYGGFRIASVSGSGTLADPFVVVEEITGPTSAVLIIEGLSPDFGNRVGTLHHTGFALRKIVHNSTPFIWSFMEFELQQDFGVSSDYLDGLSFGQGSTTGKPFKSDQFNDFLERDEPTDSIIFDGGYLRPGQSAVFDIIITDTTPIPVFFLVQQPNRPTVQLLIDDAKHIQ